MIEALICYRMNRVTVHEGLRVQDLCVAQVLIKMIPLLIVNGLTPKFIQEGAQTRVMILRVVFRK